MIRAAATADKITTDHSRTAADRGQDQQRQQGAQIIEATRGGDKSKKRGNQSHAPSTPRQAQHSNDGNPAPDHPQPHSTTDHSSGEKKRSHTERRQRQRHHQKRPPRGDHQQPEPQQEHQKPAPEAQQQKKPHKITPAEPPRTPQKPRKPTTLYNYIPDRETSPDTIPRADGITQTAQSSPPRSGRQPHTVPAEAQPQQQATAPSFFLQYNVLYKGLLFGNVVTFYWLYYS